MTDMTQFPITSDQMEALAALSATTWPDQGLVVTGDPYHRVEVRRGDDLIGWVVPSDDFPGNLLFQSAITTKDNAEPLGVPIRRLSPTPTRAGTRGSALAMAGQPGRP